MQYRRRVATHVNRALSFRSSNNLLGRGGPAQPLNFSPVSVAQSLSCRSRVNAKLGKNRQRTSGPKSTTKSHPTFDSRRPTPSKRAPERGAVDRPPVFVPRPRQPRRDGPFFSPAATLVAPWDGRAVSQQNRGPTPSPTAADYNGPTASVCMDLGAWRPRRGLLTSTKGRSYAILQPSDAAGITFCK